MPLWFFGRGRPEAVTELPRHADGNEWICPRERFHGIVAVWSYQMLTASESNLDCEGCTEVISSNTLLKTGLVSSGCLRPCYLTVLLSVLLTIISKNIHFSV